MGKAMSLDRDRELHNAGVHRIRDSDGPPPALLGAGGERSDTGPD